MAEPIRQAFPDRVWERGNEAKTRQKVEYITLEKSTKTVLTVLFIMILIIFSPVTILADKPKPNIRKIGTWNLALLGGDSWQNIIEDIDDVKHYADLIKKSGATLYALQELISSRFEHGEYSSVYLDEMIKLLNYKTNGKWAYTIGKQSNGQRLGFLYDSHQWKRLRIDNPVSGGPYDRYTKWPLFGLFRAIGHNTDFTLCIVNVHMKAMPDKVGADDENKNRGKRKAQFEKLTEYLEVSAWDADVLVCGDTNIYEVQSEANILLDQDTDKPLKDLGFKEVDGERERTSIYEGELSQRFDRFYLSPDIQKEVEAAKTLGGIQTEDLVDSLQEAAEGNFAQFAKSISDHFPVVLTLDVSKER